MYCSTHCAKSASCTAFYMDSSLCHESASTQMVTALNNGSNTLIDAWLSASKCTTV